MSRLGDLRDEHASERLGARWLSEVERICRNVTVAYSPDVYANGLSWEAELDDLAQEVVIDRLLRERQVEYIVDVAASIADARKLLARQVRITLAHRRRRTVVDQLLERARRILREPPFEQRRSSPDSWTIEDRVVGERSPTQAELRVATQRVRAIPLVKASGTDRAPMIYRTEDLERLLVVVGESLPVAFEISDLDRILSARLTPFLPGVLEDVGGGQPPPTSASQPEELMQVVDEIVAALDGSQRAIVVAKIAGVSDADIAAAFGISRPTAAKRRSRALEIVRSSLDGLNDDGQLAVIDRLGAQLAHCWPLLGGDHREERA